MFRAAIVEVDPQQHTFSKKSTENGVAVGPFEYCANGRVFRSGNRSVVYVTFRFVQCWLLTCYEGSRFEDISALNSQSLTSEGW